MYIPYIGKILSHININNKDCLKSAFDLHCDHADCQSPFHVIADMPLMDSLKTETLTWLYACACWRARFPSWWKWGRWHCSWEVSGLVNMSLSETQAWLAVKALLKMADFDCKTWHLSPRAGVENIYSMTRASINYFN